jgi:hypothetical protein
VILSITEPLNDPLTTFIDPVTPNDPEIIAEPVNGNVLVTDPVATVTLNVLASPLVNVITLLTADAVTSNEPVLTVTPAFKAYDAVIACEAEVANDADVEFNAYDALLAFIANELLVDTKAYEADVATLLNEELIAREDEIALSALEAVISKLPVIVSPKPVCNSLPLT